MREFFKPWRRKAGVATLVLACVFAAGWVRSLFAHDSVGFPLNDSRTIGVLSAPHFLIFCSQYKPGIEKKWTVTEWTTKFNPLAVDGITGAYHLGFGILTVSPCLRTNGVESMILTIPYWSLVGTFLIVSRYLLQPNSQLEPKIDPVSPLYVVMIVVAAVLVFLMTAAPRIQ